MSFNFPSFIFKVPPFGRPSNSLGLIVSQTHSYACDFQLLRQAVQKGPLSISELVHISFLFFNALSSQITLTGTNKS